jgi:hypothetical protein
MVSAQFPALIAPATRLAAVRITASSALISGIIAVIVGVLILVFPKLLNYLVAFYLIITGAILIWGSR